MSFSERRTDHRRRVRRRPAPVGPEAEGANRRVRERTYARRLLGCRARKVRVTFCDLTGDGSPERRKRGDTS